MGEWDSLGIVSTKDDLTDSSKCSCNRNVSFAHFIIFFLEFQDEIVIRGFPTQTVTTLDDKFGSGFNDVLATVLLVFRQRTPQIYGMDVIT